MTSRGRGRRPAGAALSITLAIAALLIVGPLTVSGATVTNAWRAKIGSAGANGTATVQAYTTGTGSLVLKLAKLKVSTYLPVTLYKGSCSSVGSVLLKLASIKTTSSGAATRTSSLSTGQVTLIKSATKGTARIAIRVGSSTTGGVKCGLFAVLAVPPRPLPILIDTDLAGDDIIAIAVLLRDPAVEVRAITLAGTGEVHCAAGIPNLGRILAAFRASAIPIACGRETPGPNGRYFPDSWRAAADGLYGIELPAASAPASTIDAATLIAKTAAGNERLTIVALGPWTNLADAFAADPSLPSRIAGIHAMGGAIDVAGNVDNGVTRPADRVEWNIGVDPDAVAAVFELPIPITLVPLDATNAVPIPKDIVARLEPDHVAAGADIVYELFARNSFYTSGAAYLWDPLAALALTAPSLLTWEQIPVVVKTSGIQAGRIARAEAGRIVRAAMAADGERALTALFVALRRGAPRP